MVTITVQHKVQSFEKWFEVYNRYHDERKRNGNLGDMVYPPQGDEGDVLIVGKWESTEAFDRFKQEVNLPEVMKNAGVVSPPNIQVFEDNVA